MKLNFCTKRFKNGQRLLLLIDTDAKEYATQSAAWFSRDDFVECNNVDLSRIALKCEEEGYTLRDSMRP